MPLYRNFVAPTAPIIPIDDSATFERLSADYKKSYDEAVLAEDLLHQGLLESRNKTRGVDQPLINEQLQHVRKQLDDISSSELKGFSMPKIRRLANQFAAYSKPLEQAYLAEQQDLEALSKTNLTPQEIARRQNEIRSKPSIVKDEAGVRFSYQPYQYSNKPDVNKKLLGYLSNVRPDKSSQWKNSSIIMVLPDGTAQDASGNTVKTDQQTPGVYRVDAQGNNEKISVEELEQAGIKLMQSDPEVGKFIQEEVRTRMLENPDLSQEEVLAQVTSEYIATPIDNVANMLNYDKSASASAVSYADKLSDGIDTNNYDRRGWQNTDDPVKLNLDPVKITGFTAKSFSDDPGTYKTPEDKRKIEKVNEIVKRGGGDKNDRMVTAAVADKKQETGIAQPTTQQTTVALEVLNNFADQYEGVDVTNPKDPKSYQLLKDYEETVSNLAVVPRIIPYTREGEEGRSSRDDITSDIQARPTSYTYYDIEKQKILSSEEKDNLPSKRLVATGEYPPNNPFVLATDNAAFANSHDVVLKDDDGRIIGKYVVAKKGSEMENQKGSYNFTANALYNEMFKNAGMWVEIPLKRDDFGNVISTASVKLDLDLRNKTTSGYEIQGVEGKFSSIQQVMKHLANARK